MPNPFEKHNLVRIGTHVLFAPNVPSAKKTPTRANCKTVSWLFMEADEGTKEEQDQALRASGLPLPSVTIDSGNKSRHWYWRLREPLRAVLGRALMLLLLRRCPWADQAIQGPEHLMRAPGHVHPKSNRRCEVLAFEPVTYTPLELGLFPPDSGKGSGSIPPAMEAAEYLTRRQVPEGTIAELCAAYGWSTERMTPVITPAARKAQVRDGHINVESTSTREAIKLSIETLRELCAECKASYPNSPAEQFIALKALAKDHSLLLTDQQSLSLLANTISDAEIDAFEPKDELMLAAPAQLNGIFMAGGLNILVAQEKTGKTWLITTWLSRAMGFTAGKSVCALPIQPVGHVLLILLDQSPAVNFRMLETLGMLEANTTEREGNQFRALKPNVQVIDGGQFALPRVWRWCEDHPPVEINGKLEPSVVVVDTLSRIRPIHISENSADIGTVIGQFRGMPGDPTVIISHHAGKTSVGDGATGRAIVRGSGAIFGSVDWLVTWEAPLQPNRYGRMQPNVDSDARYYEAQGRQLDKIEGCVHRHTYEPMVSEEFPDEGKRAACASPTGRTDNHTAKRKMKQWDKVLECVKANPGISTRKIAETLECSPNRSLRNMLETMVKERYIERRAGTGNTHAHFIGNSTAEEDDRDVDEELPL